jgi:hypothetical protein
LHAPPGTTFRGLRAAVPKRDQQPVQIGTGQLLRRERPACCSRSGASTYA